MILPLAGGVGKADREAGICLKQEAAWMAALVPVGAIGYSYSRDCFIGKEVAWVARIGHIDFLNVLPLTYGLSKLADRELDVMKGVPAEVNRALLRGSLAISGISSIVYAKAADELLIVPDLSVRTDAKVTSILLFSKVPAAALTGEKVVLTAKSETSHALLKILLAEVYHAQPAFEVRSLDPREGIPDDAAAALFIGDDALYLYHHPPAGLLSYDLGEAWKGHTGLGMVYSVWAIRRDFAAADPQLARRMVRLLQEGMARGHRELSAAIRTLASRKPFSAGEIEAYLKVIRHDLKEKHLAGLRLFYKKAEKLDIIDHAPELVFFR